MIKPINHFSIENIPGIYDEESGTVLELVARLTRLINEIIEDYNTKDGTLARMDKTIKDINTQLNGIGVTLGELVVGPLGFATPQMFGAIGDGEADDTQAIRAAINSLSDHNAVLYFPPGVYLVTDDIELRSNMTVKGSGEASVIKRAPNDLTHYRVFRCRNISDVVLSDLCLLGDKETHTGEDGEWGNCISLEGVRNVNIERCYLMDGWGDGVYLGAGDGNLSNFYVNIRDTKITGNRRNGISVITVDGLTIDGCLISNTGGTEPGAGIDFEPNELGQTASNVKVTNTTFSGNSKDVLFADTEQNLHFYKQVIFTACIFKSQVALDWRTPLTGETFAGGVVTFSGCQFDNSYRCIRITKSDKDTPITLTGCDLSCNGISIEVGESSKDYAGRTLGGVTLTNCRVHKNGNNPIVRGVGSNTIFNKITADLYTNKAIKAYGYFSGLATDVCLNFHDGVYQIGVSTEFDKYKVPSTIYISRNADEETFLLNFKGDFPCGQVVRVINDGTMRELAVNYNDQEFLLGAGAHAFNFTLTPSDVAVVYGGAV